MTTEPESPLTIPSPDSLTALFLADPLTLTDAQLTTLVREFRRRRSEFHSLEAANAAKGKKAKVAKTPTDPAVLDKPATEIDLSDLGIEP